MALTNAQYDAIMRDYNRVQLDETRALAARREEVYTAVPELLELEKEVSHQGASYAIHLLESDKKDREPYLAKIRSLGEKRKALLREHGYAEDYLEMHYRCPDCKDTGYIENKPCHCLRRAIIDLLYTQSGLEEILKEENFDHFSLDYYPNDLLHPVTNRSAKETMASIEQVCRNFVSSFDTEHTNLFFYGETGLGKTFLSHCIAKELIESSHSVIYVSALDLFDQLADERFGRENKEIRSLEYLTGCDLLIIDDLGTELTNSFVSSQLFQILNDRLNNRKSTVISTNLSLSSFSQTYSERVFSRITSAFRLLGFFGKDIRIQKAIAKSYL